MRVEQLLKEIGKMINNKDMDNKIGQIALFIKVCIKAERSTERENFNGLITQVTMDNLFKIISVDMEDINGKIIEFIKELYFII